MTFSQAVRRIVRTVRVGFRAARILATDSQLPWLLRILFVIGCIQVPVLPFDELAMAAALAWLLIFHRPALARAMRAARVSPEPKEHIMSARKLVIVATASLAAVAAAVSLALGAVPAFASSRPHSPRSLAVAIVSGATIGIDHVMYAAEPVSRHHHDGYPVPDRAVCVRQSPRPGHVPAAPEIGASGLTWQYVTGPQARYFHVSRCSVVIVTVNRYGQDAELVMTPSGRVVGRS